MSQSNGNNKAVKPHFVTVYETYQKNFDEAIENALQHPIWRDDPPDSINKVDGNKVVFEMNKSFTIMAMVGICERKHAIGFYWKCVVSIIVNKSGALHKAGMWTRKDKMRLMNVGQALLVGCGDRDAERSWAVEANTLTLVKEANEDDARIVELVLDNLSSVTTSDSKEKENVEEATDGLASTATESQD